jgi:hypothetical protein
MLRSKDDRFGVFGCCNREDLDRRRDFGCYNQETHDWRKISWVLGLDRGRGHNPDTMLVWRKRLPVRGIGCVLYTREKPSWWQYRGDQGWSTTLYPIQIHIIHVHQKKSNFWRFGKYEIRKLEPFKILNLGNYCASYKLSWHEIEGSEKTSYFLEFLSAQNMLAFFCLVSVDSALLLKL